MLKYDEQYRSKRRTGNASTKKHIRTGREKVEKATYSSKEHTQKEVASCQTYVANSAVWEKVTKGRAGTR